jgi:hypothetical protein
VDEAKKYVSKWEKPIRKARSFPRKELSPSISTVSRKKTKVIEKKPASDHY